MGELLRGKVTAYPGGKDKGLVEVSIGAYDQKQDKVFARVEQSIVGLYWLPEIGDTVEVDISGQPGGDARVLHVRRREDDQQTAACWTEKNDLKQLKTRSGHTITLSDTQGKTAVTILTAGGLECKLDDEKKQISLKPKDAQTPSILLNADTGKDELTLSSGKGLQFQCGGAKLEIDSSGNIKVSTNGTLNVTAQSVSLEAKLNLTAKGGQKAELSGNMTTKISGQTKLDLTSNGITQIKGSMVKLN